MWKKGMTTLALATGVLLAVSACGGSSSSGGDSAESGPVDITVGVLEIADTAPFFMAIEEGIFEKHNLNVETVPAPGGAQAASGLVSGDMQFAFGSYIPFILSTQQGAGLKIASNAVNPSETFSRVVVNGSSDLQSIDDLEGKTVAVSALTSIGSVAAQESMKAAGLNPDDVTFVEMPFPNMSAALQKDQIDAAWVVEPFLTQSKEAGARELFNLFAGDMATVPLAGYMMSASWAADNPEVVENFRAAMQEATEMAQSDEAAVRAIIPSYTGVPEDLALTIALPTFEAQVDFDALQRLADSMVDLGIMEEEFDVRAMGDDA